MAPLSGQRGSANITQNTRKPDVSAAILEYFPNASPLVTLVSRLKKRPAINPKFSWFEDDNLPRFDAVNNGAGYTSGDTSIVVDNGSYFTAGDIVYVTRTGETIRVTSIATNTLTVTRSVGSTAAALLDNDEVLIIGSAQEEGDTSRPAKTTLPVEVINYLQIFRRKFDMTETLRHSDQFTRPHDWDRQKRKTAVEHQLDKEKAFLFGHPSEIAGTTHQRRTTGGAYHYIQTNQTDMGGTMTEAEFFGGLRPPFDAGGSDTRLALASSLAIDVLNTYPRGKVQVTDQDRSSYGVNVVRYVSPHGDVNVVKCRSLAGSKFGGHMVILDLDQLEYRHLANENGSRDTHIKENVQANDADSRADEFLAEVGLGFGLEKTHAIFSNITG